VPLFNGTAGQKRKPENNSGTLAGRVTQFVSLIEKFIEFRGPAGRMKASKKITIFIVFFFFHIYLPKFIKVTTRRFSNVYSKIVLNNGGSDQIAYARRTIYIIRFLFYCRRCFNSDCRIRKYVKSYLSKIVSVLTFGLWLPLLLVYLGTYGKRKPERFFMNSYSIPLTRVSSLRVKRSK